MVYRIQKIQRIAVPLPDEVMNKMDITAGPLFEGSLEKILRNEGILDLYPHLNITQSMFNGQFNIPPCQECRLRQGKIAQ